MSEQRRLKIGEITPRFCHYLRFVNETPLLNVENWEQYHQYSRTGGGTRPGILEYWSEQEGGKRWYFRIRRGLRWSDGAFVTSEDVRYTIEDVLLQPELKRFLTNSEHSIIMMPEWEWLFWGEEAVQIEKEGENCFSLIFSQKYPDFVRQQVRSARWQMLLRPSHYLKKFHWKYGDTDFIRADMQKNGFDGVRWSEYYQWRDPPIREAGYHNPARIPEIWNYPVLDPWRFTEESSPKRWYMEKNPWYYERDGNGDRLPYICGIERSLYKDEQKLREAVENGEVDIAGCYLKSKELDKYKKLAKVCGYTVKCLPMWQVQPAVLLINQCPANSRLRTLVQQRKFREALSCLLDRERMNRKLYGGMGRCAQAAPGKQSLWYHREWEQRAARYDPWRARMLLMACGMEFQAEKAFWEGERLRLKMVYYPVTPVADEAAEEITAAFEKGGIHVEGIRLDNGSQMGEYQEKNEHVLGIWEMTGDDPMLPYQIGGLSDPIPLWWHWYETKGREGEEPTAEAKQLYSLRDRLKAAENDKERIDIGEKIWKLQAENLWCIGIAADVPQIFLYTDELRNICENEREYLPGVLLGARRWKWEEY